MSSNYAEYKSDSSDSDNDDEFKNDIDKNEKFCPKMDVMINCNKEYIVSNEEGKELTFKNIESISKFYNIPISSVHIMSKGIRSRKYNITIKYNEYIYSWRFKGKSEIYKAKTLKEISNMCGYSVGHISKYIKYL